MYLFPTSFLISNFISKILSPFLQGQNFIPVSTAREPARACESLLSVNRARPMMDYVFFSLSVNDRASSTDDELCVLLCDTRERSVDDHPMVDYMYFYNY